MFFKRKKESENPNKERELRMEQYHADGTTVGEPYHNHSYLLVWNSIEGKEGSRFRTGLVGLLTRMSVWNIYEGKVYEGEKELAR